MATIKIILERNEDELEVREDLAKALVHGHGGTGKFDDPILAEIEQIWNVRHSRMLNLWCINFVPTCWQPPRITASRQRNRFWK